MVENATPEERIAQFLEMEENPQSEEKTVTHVEDSTEEETTEVQDGNESEEEEEDKEVSEESKEDSEEESVQIGSWQELAEHLGTDPAELYNLTIPITGADGQKQEVTIGEWKDSYQALDKVRSEQEKITQERSTFNETAKVKMQQLDQYFNQAAQFVEIAEKQLVGQIDNARLEELRYSDPGEFAAVKQEIADRANAIQIMKQQVSQEYSEYQNALQEHYKSEKEKWLQQEQIRTPELIPEWANRETMETESKDLKDYLVNVGYGAEVVDSFSATDKMIARKAMLYDRQQKAMPEKKKKVISIGKVVKSGKTQTKADRKTQEFDRDVQKFRKSGDVHDMAAVIEKHLLGDMK